MTAEKLHDALTLLPSDLIAETDRMRNRQAKVIHWKHYAAIAACLAVVVSCGLTLQSRFLSGSDAAVNKEALSAQCAAEPTEMAPPEIGTDTTDNSAADANEEPAAILDEGLGALSTTPSEDIVAEKILLQFDSVINIPATQYAETRNIGTGCTTSEPVIRLLRSPAELDAFREKFAYYDLENFDACCEIYDESWFESHDLLVVLMKALPEDSTTRVTSMVDLDENGVWELCISYDISYEATALRTDRFILMEAEKDVITDERTIAIILE